MNRKIAGGRKMKGKSNRRSKNYYDILGVRFTATPKEIRTKYWRLARRYHPDLNNGDSEKEDRFKEISMVYSILGHPQRRRSYDLKLIEQMLH